MTEILYSDSDILVCIKPAGILSTDEPGGLPSVLCEQTGASAGEIRTVHRLDRVVSGVMVLARSAEAASKLSEQVRGDTFSKEYLAVVRGRTEESGEMRDLLIRDRRECKTYVTDTPAKGVQEAVLTYRTLKHREGLSLVAITLITGRTHQIRCQFSSRGMPIAGDRKYGGPGEDGDIALLSHKISFIHPSTGIRMTFTAEMPETYPWTLFI